MQTSMSAVKAFEEIFNTFSANRLSITLLSPPLTRSPPDHNTYTLATSRPGPYINRRQKWIVIPMTQFTLHEINIH